MTTQHVLFPAHICNNTGENLSNAFFAIHIYWYSLLYKYSLLKLFTPACMKITKGLMYFDILHKLVCTCSMSALPCADMRTMLFVKPRSWSKNLVIESPTHTKIMLLLTVGYLYNINLPPKKWVSCH